MHAGHIQRVAAAADAQKSRALFKSLGAQAGHFQQLLAVGKRAVGFAPFHDGFGHCGAQARYAAEQWRAGGVQVHAHAVHAVLHHGVELTCQLTLVHVVLVLAHANGFGIDLDQFGQRILQAAGNAGGSAQAHIHIGQLLTGIFTGAVDGGSCFADHHFQDFGLGHVVGCSGFFQQLDQVACQLVGFTAGRAVADGNQLHTMLGTQPCQCVQAAVPVAARLVRVHGGGVH